MKGSKVLTALAGLAALTGSGAAHAIAWYFQTPGSQIARDIDNLHQYVMWLIIVIFVAVFGAMFWSCYAHRKSKGHPAEQFHENTTVEILWTVIPAIILVIIAWPVTKVVIAQKDTSAPDLTIKVTGYQWYWGYEYPDQKIAEFTSNVLPEADAKAKNVPYLLATDHAMVVPVHSNVRLLVTGADVIHDVGVPAFVLKTDAVPGRVNQTWFNAEQTGTFYGQCDQLCGVNHAFMPIEIKVVTRPEFDAWVASRHAPAVAATPAPAATQKVASAATVVQH